MKQEQTIEQIIAEVLRMKEDGGSVPEIYAAFPKAESEIKALFYMLALLEKERGVLPPRALLEKILEKTAVTNPLENRYREHSGDVGRHPIVVGNITESLVTIMNKWKIIIPVGVVALLLIVFASSRSGSPDTSLTMQR